MTARSTRGTLYFSTTPLMLIIMRMTVTMLAANGSVGVAEAKTVSGSFQLSSAHTQHVLTKFSLSEGVSKARFNVTFHSPDMDVNEHNFTVRLYNDEDWYHYQYRSPTCDDKIELARDEFPVVWHDPGENTDENNAEKERQANKPNDQWEAHVSSALRVTVRRNQYWYFVVDDCALELADDDDTTPTITYRLQVWDAPSFRMLKTDEVVHHQLTHVPAEEEGMMFLHLVVVVSSLLLASWLLVRTILPSFCSVRGAHVAPMVVLLACVLNGASSLSELIHLEAYEVNGVGNQIFDALAAHFEALSDSLVALLLICVGSGWTLPANVVPSVGGGDDAGWLSLVRTPAASSSGQVFSLVIIGLHAALAQWGRAFQEDFDVYHSLEHFPGRVLMLLRASLSLAFLAGVTSVRQSGKCPRSLEQWLQKFALVGVVWFLSLPFVATLCGSLPYIGRHQALSMGTAAVQSTSLTGLVWLVGGNTSSSAYHAISRTAVTASVGGDFTELTAQSSTSSSAHTNKVWTWGKTKIRLD